MSQSSVLLIVLFFYTILLIAIGLWTKGRNKDQKDFFLGGRNLGPIVASLSYSASAASAWTLLGLTGLTYLIGVSSIWVVLGSFLGAVISWFISVILQSQTRCEKKENVVLHFKLPNVFVQN